MRDRSRYALLSLLCALAVSACADEPTPDADLLALSDAELASTLCSGCHLVPEPEMLDKDTWEDWVLPAMGWRFGIYQDETQRADSVIEPGVGGVLVEQAGIYPREPIISEAVWERVVSYYVSRAPERLPGAPPRPEVKIGLDRFRVRIPEYRPDPPMVTLSKIIPGTGRLYVSDAKRDFSTLDILDLDRPGPALQTIGLESSAVNVRLREDRADVLLVGKLLPTNEPSGLLRSLIRAPDGTDFIGAERLIDGLHRPVHASYADLDGDGLEDVVISEFGFELGRLAWYRQTAQGYEQNVLLDRPGAVVTRLTDFDGDGILDIVALMAQGAEGVFLFRNLGGGRFAEEPLVRFPASYGSTDIELHDFDGDGRLDILYVNGDNGDYDPIAKPYHGIRILLQEEGRTFREAGFFPMYGAFQARARDFDLDGDLDVAVVAFYPDFRNLPREGFLYLENTGDFAFAPSTFEGVDDGRWITLDAGDLDGDGDDDLALGSFVAFDPTGDTTGLGERWLREGPAVVVLENKTR